MWTSLKQLIKNNEKFIIIEDGEPRYVIMPYKEYQKLQGLNPVSASSDIESVNREMQNINDITDESLKLEDLPF